MWYTGIDDDFSQQPLMIYAIKTGAKLQKSSLAETPMAQAEVTMIPQTYVTLTDETDIKNLQRTLDLLDEDDDVQNVYHNWDE